MEEAKEDQLWHFRENTANKFTPQPVTGQKTQTPTYSSLGDKTWTRIKKESGSRTRLPKAGRSNLILDTTPPNLTACGGSEACWAVTLHTQLQTMYTSWERSFLYQTLARRVWRSHSVPLKSSLHHSAHAAVPFATPNSIHLFEALYAAFFFAKCLWTLCQTREAMGRRRSEMNHSKLQTLLHGRTSKWQKVVLQPTKFISLFHFKEETRLFFIVINILLSFIGQPSLLLFYVCLYINTYVCMCIFLCLVHTQKHRNI